jgi:hypothetical protein
VQHHSFLDVVLVALFLGDYYWSWDEDRWSFDFVTWHPACKRKSGLFEITPTTKKGER